MLISVLLCFRCLISQFQVIMGIKVQRSRCFLDIGIGNVLGKTAFFVLLHMHTVSIGKILLKSVKFQMTTLQ